MICMDLEDIMAAPEALTEAPAGLDSADIILVLPWAAGTIGPPWAAVCGPIPRATAAAAATCSL